MKSKSIKDAIHGYIKLEEPYWKIIDTAEFQRLKWVEQTSYRVLYPSARHDRFIHSIGVYHLGQKAINGFINNSSQDDIVVIEHYKHSFLLACLLHDIGHAPFSHTCEDLFNYQDKISLINSKINAELTKCLDNALSQEKYDTFVRDYEYILSPKGKSPSEHEVMSAIIICQKFDEYCELFKEIQNANIDLDLIVRAVLGCTYAINHQEDIKVKNEKGIKNCLIRLLNSSTVDVDKLDYIARDTQMSGYDNIVVDTERLLDSVCLVCKENVYYPAFKKSALSVINNVIIAKNAQAKWIVNHPIVIYDAYVLRRAIGETLKNVKIYCNKQLLSNDEAIRYVFSSASLSKKGNCYDTGAILLLSDVDLLTLMKQNISNEYVSEYFARNERKSPIWKSNEEYLYCLESDLDKACEIATFMAPLISYINDIVDLSHIRQIDNSLYDDIVADNELEGKDELIKILDILKNYKASNGKEVELDYVILPAKNRFFAKINSKDLLIKFDDSANGWSTYEPFENKHIDIPKNDYQFFYLYSKEKLEAKHFLNYLYEEIHSNNSIRM